MFSRPAVGGEAEGQVTSTGRYYGKAAKLPYNEYLTGGDVRARLVGPRHRRTLRSR